MVGGRGGRDTSSHHQPVEPPPVSPSQQSSTQLVLRASGKHCAGSPVRVRRHNHNMQIWFLVLTILSALLPLCPGLSVVPDDWRPRERGVRGARGYGRGINLYGSPKRHGSGRQECPKLGKILPCRCKAKTNGLDITCEKVSLSQIKHSSEALKQEVKNKSSSEVDISLISLAGDYSIH